MSRSSREDADRISSPGALPPALLESLQRYLDLEIRRLQREQVELAERARRQAMARNAGQMLTWALLLVAYAMAVALLSQRALLDALLLPAQWPQLIAERVAGSVGVLNSIPDSIRAILVPLVGSLLLVMFRSSALSLRANVAGVLFAALTSVALLGLSAGSASGAWGSAAAAPGLLACAGVMYVFVQTLRKVEAVARQEEPDLRRRASAGLLYIRRRWAGARRWLDPAERAPVGVLFVLLPIVSAGLIAASLAIESDATAEDPAKAVGQLGILAWAGWGLLVTPNEARIALWSLPIWTLVIGWSVALGSVAGYFFVATLGVLVVNVAAATLRRRPVALGSGIA